MSVAVDAIPALGRARHAAASGRRRRLAFWRSPDGQPSWARPALLGVAALAALLYAWHITGAGLAPFYATAVKSMSESWKAFFYGAFDPQASITIDKLAGSFLPQALSARIFGFHPWSLALPQVIEGVVSVLVLYRVVRRWAGAVPGLLAAGIFALTPVLASMFGHSMEDGALTMCLVLAADSYQRAVGEARLRALIGAGVWVGLGFQAKMLQAWMVLPALAIGYLVAAPVRLRRRLWHLGVAGLAMVAVSLSWIALYAVTPASDRPYVDGSTTNSAFAMVFGYNGLERFGITVPGVVSSGPGVGGGAASDLLKLAGSRFGPEIGWLYPLALLALAAGLVALRRARRTDPTRAGLVMWGVWLLTFGVIYSAMGTIPHTAYVASLAPPIAALSAFGIVLFGRWYLAGDRRGWLLPAAVAVELAWAGYLWSSYPSFLPWLRWVILVAGVAALAVLSLRLLPAGLSTRLATAGLVAGVAVMLAAPATWAMSVLDERYAGSSFDAAAGPAGAFSANGGGGGQPQAAGAGRQLGRPSGGPPSGGVPSGGAGGGGFPGGGRPSGQAGGGAGGAAGGPLASATTALSPAERALYRYVSAHRDGATYLFAVSSWSQASPYILVTGQEVLPLGGFSGSVPSPTLAAFRQLVRSGQLKFVLLGGGQSQATAITTWVMRTCTAVPAKDYAAASAQSAQAASGTLYACGG